LLARVDARDDHRGVRAERAFLRVLGAGCSLPAGALARPAGDPGDPDRIELDGLLASADGRVVVRGRLSGDDPEALGAALAHMLVRDRGASSLAEWEALELGAARG
ncbi:MAG: hypothetical protein ACRDXC_05935, partial [Acidimicrobiales bacterium]